MSEVSSSRKLLLPNQGIGVLECEATCLRFPRAGSGCYLIRVLSGICLEREIIITADIMAQPQTQSSLNTNLDCCCYGNLHGDDMSPQWLDTNVLQKPVASNFCGI
jgi:hypothetical protein